MAPQATVENSIESLQKLLESLNGASERAEHDFNTLEQKPDMENALSELTAKVASLKEATHEKIVEDVPKASDDVGTELGQLELAAQGAVKEMENLEQLLESADLNLVAVVAETETQRLESYSAFTQSHTTLAEHLTSAVAAAEAAHEQADSVSKRLREIIEESKGELQEHFEAAKDALEQAVHFVDQTLAASVDNTMQTITTTFENTVKGELETTLDTFEDRIPDDVAWLIKVEEHMGGVAGGCISSMNLLGRHCVETVAPDLEKKFEKALTEAVPELVNELLQDLMLASVALAASEGIHPLVPELAVADKTLEEFNAEVEKISADAP